MLYVQYSLMSEMITDACRMHFKCHSCPPHWIHQFSLLCHFMVAMRSFIEKNVSPACLFKRSDLGQCTLLLLCFITIKKEMFDNESSCYDEACNWSWLWGKWLHMTDKKGCMEFQRQSLCLPWCMLSAVDVLYCTVGRIIVLDVVLIE